MQDLGKQSAVFIPHAIVTTMPKFSLAVIDGLAASHPVLPSLISMSTHDRNTASAAPFDDYR